MTTFNPTTVQRHLAGVDYPATKEQLIETARGHNAPDEVYGWLEGLPNQEYDTPAEVMKALGEED